MASDVDLESIVAVVGDAVVVSDSRGAIVLWNAAAQRMFGYSEGEALGQSLDLITPERLRQRHWHGYHNSMKTGQTRYGNDTLRVPAVHKDGTALSIAFTIGMLKNADGTVSGVAAVIRDETKRWAEDRELRRRLNDLERKIASSGHPQAGSA